jgi:hypothetical protein
MPAWLASVLALVPIVQSLAAGMKSLPSAWDPNYRVRIWYKLWNAVATFPGSASTVAAPEGASSSTPPKNL